MLSVVNDYRRRFRLGRIAVDILFVAATLLSVAWAASLRSNLDLGTRPQLSCRRIAAVYIAMRLYGLEERYLPYPQAVATPLERVEQYIRNDPANPVPAKLIPDLEDYDLDLTFLSNSPPVDRSTIVIAAKARDKKANARLVVLTDGTIKAVRTTQPLAGKSLTDITDPVFAVTPEEGILVPGPKSVDSEDH